jgi:ribosomal protein S18 acetylase RimI-like enzyme
MDINIIKADRRYLDDCKIALMNSELGRTYFADEKKALNTITEGITKEEIFVALNDEDICIGFIWVILNGTFHSFPYLHIIAVKDEYRNLGIGKKLMEYFEKVVSEGCSKVFLVVADFNPKAKQLYQRIGYNEVGKLPNLYKNGITEYLMMKEL